MKSIVSNGDFLMNFRKLISSLTTTTTKTTSNLYYQKPHFLISLSHLNYFFSTKTQNPDLSTVQDCLINKHGLSPETASKASPFITRARNPENYYSVLTFLGENGFSTTGIQRIVRQIPRILECDLDKIIKPKLKIFKDIGLSSDDIAQMITSDPSILTRSADKWLLPTIVMLKSILGSDLSVRKFLMNPASGWALRENIEKTMIPNIEFLVSRGISRTDITKLVISYPRHFIMKLDSMKDYVKRVEELGLDMCSNKFLYAIRVLCSMTRKNWENKLELFRSFGFSEDQILFMFKRAPNVFAISDRKLRGVTEFLLSTGRCDIMFFANRPEFFIYSLEGRIKPRILILEILEKKNLLPKQPSLASYLSISNEAFLKKYVSLCEDEAGKVFPLATKARN